MRNLQQDSAIDLLTFLRKNDLHTVFPNVDIAYRMLLSIPISNCSAERSFSVLKRVKNYMRSTMKEERLNSLSIMHIESDVLLSLDYDDIIDTFAQQNCRRKQF